uniref:Helitron helicase-like domain-containing protein n=1 Tax=Amphimedon queenslandica TaxID=400682 RepID=A0A1X7V600_AMPQE
MRLRDSVSIAMRNRSSSSLGSTGHITAGELLNGDLSEKLELSENSYAFLHNIRGASAYWDKAKLDLFAMFRTLGPPTFFITLSADDMNWFDLMCVLAICD